MAPLPSTLPSLATRGHYVCSYHYVYVYFTQLARDPARAVLVYVPPLGTPYTGDQVDMAPAGVVRGRRDQVLSLDQPPPRPLDLSCDEQRCP